jgi:hypothetical protein
MTCENKLIEGLASRGPEGTLGFHTYDQPSGIELPDPKFNTLSAIFTRITGQTIQDIGSISLTTFDNIARAIVEQTTSEGIERSAVTMHIRDTST